jgi:tetratricopeptide (TPR) repeat protein
MGWYSKAIAFTRLKKFGQAIAYYEKAIKCDQSFAHFAYNNEAWIVATNMKKNKKKNKQALSIVEKALKILPDNTDFLDTKGTILYNLGNYKEASNILNKASLACRKLGDDEKADIYLKKSKRFRAYHTRELLKYS